MTADQIKEDRNKLEITIFDLLNEFEKLHGVEVDAVDLMHSTRLPGINSELVHVHLDVRI